MGGTDKLTVRRGEHYACMYPSDSYYVKYSPQDSNVEAYNTYHQLISSAVCVQAIRSIDGYRSSRPGPRVLGHEITSHEWDAHRPYVRAAPGVTEVGYARARSSAGAVDVRTCTRPRRLQLARPRTHRHHVYSHFSPRHTCNSAVRYVETATLRGQVYGPSLL
jgi:hypothetical protein